MEWGKAARSPSYPGRGESTPAGGLTLATVARRCPLRTGGILDSVATLKLVTFVEERFGIEVDAHEAGVEHFDRIEDIATLIARKRQGR